MTVVSDGSWRASREAVPQWEQPALDDSAWKAAIDCRPLWRRPWARIGGLASPMRRATPGGLRRRGPRDPRPLFRRARSQTQDPVEEPRDRLHPVAVHRSAATPGPRVAARGDPPHGHHGRARRTAGRARRAAPRRPAPHAGPGEARQLLAARPLVRRPQGRSSATNPRTRRASTSTR